MQIHTAPFEKRGEPRDSEHPGLAQAPEVQALTDEEAFYAAQEEAFADLRARSQARPRRKP
jgi:hypothetical protein